MSIVKGKRMALTPAQRQQRRREVVKAEEANGIFRPKRQIDYLRESRERKKKAMDENNEASLNVREPSPAALQRLQHKMELQERRNAVHDDHLEDLDNLEDEIDDTYG